jgi:cyclase
VAYADLLRRRSGWSANLHRACSELDGTRCGGQIGIVAALSDMVGYNGGRPLTCCA